MDIAVSWPTATVIRRKPDRDWERSSIRPAAESGAIRRRVHDLIAAPLRTDCACLRSRALRYEVMMATPEKM